MFSCLKEEWSSKTRLNSMMDRIEALVVFSGNQCQDVTTFFESGTNPMLNAIMVEEQALTDHSQHNQ